MAKVVLEFEKPIYELEQKIEEIKCNEVCHLVVGNR